MILIKIGGGKNLNLPAIAADIAGLWHQGQKLIVVHGASQTRDQVAKRLGVKVQVVESPSGVESVFSDLELIKVFLMTYAGWINKEITALLIKNKVNAVGLCGVDGLLWQAKHKSFLYVKEGPKIKLKKDNYSGKVIKVNVDLIEILLANNYLPVITAPAVTEKGEIVNTDNDTAIAVMAKYLPIKIIISLFEAPGFLANADDDKSVIKKIRKDKLRLLLPKARGRMKKKVLGAIEAFENGVKKIYWGDGRLDQPISKLLAGQGSIIE